MSEFAGKRVVVTGGNSGIGKACAHKFAEEGAEVVIFGRNQERLEKTASAVGGKAVAGDVKNLKDLDSLFSQTGEIDVLIVNAGISKTASLGDITETLYDDLMNTNVKGAFFTAQKGAPHMKKGGSIIFISSVAGKLGLAGHAIYSATKGAIDSFNRCLAGALAEKGVRVNAISPGFIETPIWGGLREKDPKAWADREQRVPTGTFGTSEQVADGAYFLASDAASYVVGHDLVIDGGLIPVFKW